jgi:DNA-binding NtrC family response regulator
MKPRVLVADDNANVRTALRLLLESEQMQIDAVATPAEALARCRSNPYDAILIDLNYALDTTSGQEGLQLVAAMNALEDCPPIVVMTGWATVDLAVAAMKGGAADFIAKPWDNERLLQVLRAQVDLARARASEKRLRAENELLRDQLQPQDDDGLVAVSTTMRSLLDRLGQLARSDMSILLTGENGTGKSLLAAYLHRRSARAQQSFIAVNMSAVTESLFESEMFGHVKGAFTDAHTSRIGRFELAERGTIFLDEIGNMSVVQQGKLLRVIEERAFERVGSSRTQQADVRIVSATNVDLDRAVAEGRFRQDLFYRLNTVALHVPPLRERRADIAPLAAHFLARHARKYARAIPRLGVSALQALQQHDWPGNVRELGHLMERALFLGQRDTIEAADLQLPGAIGAAAVATETASDPDALPSFDAIERDLLERRLARFQGNAIAAARSLGMSRSAFYRRLEKHGLGGGSR